MSKDIRSYFQLKKPPKPKIEDDDDIIPESPDVQIKNKKKQSRNKRIIIDDSDEEIFTTKKKKSNDNSTKKKTPDKSALKEVKVTDLFGSGPIKRSEPLVTKSKKKTETGIHSDEEFEKSLLEVDAIEEMAFKQKSPLKADVRVNGVHKEIKREKSPHKKDSHVIKEGKESKHLESSKNKTVTVNGECAKRGRSKSKEMKSKKDNYVKDDKNKSNESHGSSESRKLENGEGSRNDKKRDFSEFLENDTSINDETPKNKKKKLDTSLNDSVLTDEERHERKRHSAALYQKYLNRSGPKHLGAKQIPEGSPDCLANCAFLLTGVLDSFEREEIAGAITKYGGCIKNSISKKVTHVLAGDDAGPAKMAKAQELGIKIIGEDEFLQMVQDSSKKKSDKVEVKKEHRNKTPKRSDKSPREETKSKREGKKEKSQTSIKSEVKSKTSNKDNRENKIEVKKEIKSESVVKLSDSKDQVVSGSSSHSSITPAVGPPNTLMWVEKYKPQSIKQIIGQHGDASNVKKLINWLTKWYVNRKAKLPKPSPWAKNDDGGYFKAALLSGPPGVGKTTTVGLVCKELGFDVVEFNASDTRNKTLIKEQIGELLTTTSLSAYAKGETGKQAVTKKHVLVMDEVDGMAGNEDRGGLQELISLIKSTSVPIICMCNDRNSQKMRSLVNYCYDLRFNRPRVEQIRAAMMSMCCKEGLKIHPDVVSQLIVAANQDVRQTINLLSLWSVDSNISDTDRLKKDAKSIKKDIKLGPWEAIRKVFSSEEHKTMSINDKSDLFFFDYSLAPLFVQENYLQVAPHCPKHEVLERLGKAADSISLGDLVDARIRRSQAWSLLPIQAMYSSVIPGHMLSGHITGQIQFPGWLGKNSRATKMNRLCQEIHAHTRLSTSGSKSSIFLDYAPHLRDAIAAPLLKEKADGIEKSLEVLESYHLLREDLDSLSELSLWPGQRDPMILIDSKVKAAMTRTYNKKALSLPYAPGSIKRGRAREDDEEDGEQEEVHDSDPENDALIKKMKSKEDKHSSSKEPGTSKSSSKGKQSSSKSKKK